MSKPARKRLRLSEDSEKKNETTLVANESDSEESEEEQPLEEPKQVKLDNMSRQQRKRRKKEVRQSKRDQLLHKLETQKREDNNKNKAPKRQSKFKFDDMNLLLDNEEERIKNAQKQAESRQKPKKMTSKRKQKQMVQEVQQLENVFKHPAFVSNPIGTIQEHLANKVRTNPTATSTASTTVVQPDAKRIRRKANIIRRDVSGMKSATPTEKVTGKRKR